ncbi:hypothetical protein AAZX31_06G118600 [Glycine max]|nr:hypothetical protein JHK87_015018 [Glycine soja]KAG5148217.1 hypothetical protein JHK82_015098 [Glycine max]KHN23408.1 Putative beta-1,3-galactosyltransferase 11 [Glycine soja]
MQSRGSSHRVSSMGNNRSRIPALLISMFAAFASIYVAGRLWLDAENRVYLIKELDRITGQGQSAISVDDTLKIIACREQHKKLDALETELAGARQEGFVSNPLIETNGTYSTRRPLVVIGILTKFGRQKNRDAIRKAWMGSGASLKKIEEGKGIIVRFVIGRSENRGDSQDKDIDHENRLTNDFLILDNHVETNDAFPKKAKLFFAHAADKWDAEFYAKVNDDVYVNIDALGATLATHLDKPRVYMGCMKSGEVFSELNHKWYEPEWWKFGDKKSYFRHASGEMYVISRALAKFISINRSILRTYAHDDVSAGSWFIGLDVKHVDEAKFCCSSWSTGAICAGV